MLATNSSASTHGGFKWKDMTTASIGLPVQSISTMIVLSKPLTTWSRQPKMTVAPLRFVHGLAFEQSKDYVDDVRKRLMDPIVEINDYSKNSFYTEFRKQSGMEGRQQLKDITKQLHLVSQTCDTGIANADMSLRLCEDMLDAYDRFVGPCGGSLASWRQTRDSMAWVLKTWSSQKNWLVNYKARKDTAMNFVSSNLL